MAVSRDPTPQRIEDLVRRRIASDRRMGYVWMIVPLLPVLAAVAIGVAIGGVLSSILSGIGNLSQPPTTTSAIQPIVGGLAAIYGFAILVFFGVLFIGALGFYYMIDRRNRHFVRQQLLFSSLHRFLANRAPPSENISQLGYLAEDLASEERPRSAGVWAILFLFVNPIVGLIASYNLTQDLRRHDEYQSKYEAALAPCLIEAGFQQADLPPYKSRKRDPVLFVILYAITGGLFWIYWYYTLLKDYNAHFLDQARFEDKLLSLIVPPQTQKSCGTCGGMVPASARFCPNCGTKQAS